MRAKSIKIISITASLAILVMLVIYANPEKFVLTISGSDRALILAAFFISTLNAVVRTLKWKVLLGRIKLSALMPIQLLGITVSNFSPGKVAEPVKSVILKLATGRPVSATLPSVVWERLLDVIALLSLSVLGLLFFLPLTGGGNLYVVSVASFAFFALVVGVVMLFLYNARVRARIFKLVEKFPVLNRLSENFIETFEKSFVSPKNISYSLVITFLAWVLEGFILHFSLLSIGVNLHWLKLASIFALATIIGVATALPGGIGSTDIAMVIFLGMLGVENSVAVTGVLLSRFLSIWYVNFLGGVSLIYLVKKSRLDYKTIFT